MALRVQWLGLRFVLESPGFGVGLGIMALTTSPFIGLCNLIQHRTHTVPMEEKSRAYEHKIRETNITDNAEGRLSQIKKKYTQHNKLHIRMNVICTFQSFIATACE